LLVGTPVTGPEVLPQVIPATPVIDQLPAPEGVRPPVGPATVAVKVKLDPSVAVGELVETLTVGCAFATLMLYGEVGPAPL